MVHLISTNLFILLVPFASKSFRLHPSFVVCEASKTNLHDVLNELSFHTARQGIKNLTWLSWIIPRSFIFRSSANCTNPKSCSFFSDYMTLSISSGIFPSFLTRDWYTLNAIPVFDLSLCTRLLKNGNLEIVRPMLISTLTLLSITVCSISSWMLILSKRSLSTVLTTISYFCARSLYFVKYLTFLLRPVDCKDIQTWGGGRNVIRYQSGIFTNFPAKGTSIPTLCVCWCWHWLLE